MRISVRGFKSIKSVKDFRIEPINILAGINSSGKSSLTQSLLLLKQTLESDSKEMIKLNGPYVYAENLQDLLYGKNKTNDLEYNLWIDGHDIVGNETLARFLQDENIDHIELALKFISNGTIHLKEMGFTLCGEKGTCKSMDMKRNQRQDVYQVSTNDARMLGLAKNAELTLKSCHIEFSNFLPMFGESKAKNTPETMFAFPVIKAFRDILSDVFSQIYYIGPIRVKPALAMAFDNMPQTEYIEPDGSNTRYILFEKRNMKLQDGTTLYESVNRWICRQLNLAEQIDTTKETNQLYRTKLKNKEGLNIDLCHMGFGISQILPIIVQGLLMPPGGILIVEDPCVHMHPSVQAAMVDFMLDLAEHNQCRFVVETHSDHIVTRLRRRVAEGKIWAEKINLTFVSMKADGSCYQKIGLTGQGAFSTKLPEGFLDTQDNDFRAIIETRRNR